MPLRKPHPGESERDYVYRYCVPREIDAGRPQRQARAICYSLYRRKDLKDLNDLNTQEGNMKEVTVRIDDEGTAPWEESLVTDGKGLEDWEIDFLADLALATSTKAVTKTEGDGQHPASHYLVVEDPQSPSTWHLRVRDVSGKPDHRLMGGAWAALHGGYRGNKYEGPNKSEAISKLRRLYEQEDLPVPGGGEKAVDQCVCPECGTKASHTRGVPCVEMKCPKCGAKMVGSTASTTGAETTTTEEGIARQVANAVIRAVSGLTKGRATKAKGVEGDVEGELEDLGFTPDVDFYPGGEDDKSDDFDESTITWLSDDQAADYEAPEGYKILGTIGDGEEMEFVLEPLEGVKEDKGDADEVERPDGENTTDQEDKSGRRVRSTKLDDLRRLKKEIEEALQALDAVIGWGDYKEEEEEEEGAKGDSDDLPTTWMSEKSLQALSDHGSVAFSFKAKDDSVWWMQWTMNSFQDREGEIFSTKSISDYVDRHESDETQGQFWFWHIPGTHFGDVRWQAQVGRFLVQAGPFGDDPIATQFKQFFADYPDGHPDIAPFGWGTSHKYEYKSTDRQDGVYDWFEIKESTVLPWHEASNPWSPRPHTMEVDTVNEKQKAALEAIGGADFVALIERTGEARTKELESAAIDYKDKTSYATRIRALASKCDDGVKAKLESFCKKLDKQFPPRQAAPPPEEEEEEEEGEMGKDTSKSEKGTDSVDVLKELGKELSALAKEIGGDTGTKLATIAGEMGGSEKSDDGKKDDEAKSDEAKETETPPSGTESKAIDPNLFVTKDDFKDAVGALITTIREEMAEGFKAINDKLATTEETVTDLSRTDEAKIAEKAAGVPVQSLGDIMSELLGAGTQISEGEKLARKQPKQADQGTDGITPVPGLNWLMNQPTE